MRNFEGKMIQSPQQIFVRSLLPQNFARSILSKRGIEINSLNKSDQKYIDNGNLDFIYIQTQKLLKTKQKEHLEDNHRNVNIDLLVIKEFCVIIRDGIIVL